MIIEVGFPWSIRVVKLCGQCPQHLEISDYKTFVILGMDNLSVISIQWFSIQFTLGQEAKVLNSKNVSLSLSF